METGKTKRGIFAATAAKVGHRFPSPKTGISLSYFSLSLSLCVSLFLSLCVSLFLSLYIFFSFFLYPSCFSVLALWKTHISVPTLSVFLIFQTASSINPFRCWHKNDNDNNEANYGRHWPHSDNKSSQSDLSVGCNLLAEKPYYMMDAMNCVFGHLPNGQKENPKCSGECHCIQPSSAEQ